MRSCSNFSGALRSTPIRENTGGRSFHFRTASSPTSSAPGWKVWADLGRQHLGDHEGSFPVTFRRDGAGWRRDRSQQERPCLPRRWGLCWPRALRHGQPACPLRRRTTRAHEPRPRRLPSRIQALSSVAGSIEVALAGSCLRCTLTVPPARGSSTENGNDPTKVECIATRPTSGRNSPPRPGTFTTDEYDISTDDARQGDEC